MPGLLTRILILWLCAFHSAHSFAEEKAEYKLEHLQDNIYCFSAGHHRSVFMATADGLFLTDPISEEIATYLRARLSQRFTTPIRYVAYSHNHIDRILGGHLVAGNGAVVVARKKLETHKTEIRLREFADLPMHQECSPLNVAGVYKTLVERLYLFAPKSRAYYEKLGWVLLRRQEYKGERVDIMVREFSA